jgi:sugar lactone lactonase YvrE
MKEYVAQPATASAYQLGEGPVWDAANDRLLWVDITAGDVHEGRLRGDTIEPIACRHIDSTVGAVALAEDHGLLVAGHQAVYLVNEDGELATVARLVSAGQQRRLNDGKCDPAGRFLVGTLPLGEEVAESLYRVDAHNGTTTVDDDLQMSNGLGWSPDGSIFYSVDTTPGIIWRRAYDPPSGCYGDRHEAFRVTDGSPDGLCVDTGGNLWLAIWGPGQVRRYSPSGDCLAIVHVDAPYTSCVTFAGDNLDRLVITTAIDDLSPQQRESHPRSGCLFLADVDARGLPTTAWRSNSLSADE